MMGEFTLETSGVVRVELSNTGGARELGLYRWHNLSPFEQGYVEAAIRSIELDAKRWGRVGTVNGAEALGFSHLAPETLALILKDCEVAASILGRNHLLGDGTWFWSGGQRQPGFPPLAAYLGDDGKVYLREARS